MLSCMKTWSPKFICVYVVLINVVTCYMSASAECEFMLSMFRSIYISAVISISVKQIDIRYDLLSINAEH